MKKRYRVQKIAYLFHALVTLAIASPVALILIFLIMKGGRAITWEFLTKPPVEGMTAGGIFPCIAGTFYLATGTLLLALPIGVMGAIYLTEYATQNLLTRAIHLCIVNLAGVPSIVYGLFGLGAFVIFLKLGVSVLAGAMTLAILVLPIIITATEEALLTVPRDFREASLSLGATKWHTIRNVVLPNAWSGIITGSILAIGRAAGETAPVLFTVAAYYLPHVPGLKEAFSRNTQVMVLPYHLFVISTQVPDAAEQLQWGTALVLLMLILMMSLGGILLRSRLRTQRKW